MFNFVANYLLCAILIGNILVRRRFWSTRIQLLDKARVESISSCTLCREIDDRLGLNVANGMLLFLIQKVAPGSARKAGLPCKSINVRYVQAFDVDEEDMSNPKTGGWLQQLSAKAPNVYFCLSFVLAVFFSQHSCFSRLFASTPVKPFNHWF